MRTLILSILLVGTASASFFDHFTGTSLNARWGTAVAGNGVICVNGTNVAGSGTACSASVTGESFAENQSDTATTDAAFIWYSIDTTKAQIIRVMAKRPTTTNSSSMVWITNHTSAPTPTTSGTSGFEGRTVARLGPSKISVANDISVAAYFDSTGTSTSGGARKEWDTGTQAWVTGGTATNVPSKTDNYVMYVFQLDPTNSQFRMAIIGATGTGMATANQGGMLQYVTDWVPYSSARSFTSLNLVIGDPYTNGSDALARIEWIAVDDGTRDDAMINVVNFSGGTAYGLRHVYGYRGENGYTEFMLPKTRATNELAVTGAAWDSNQVARPNLVYDGSTVYLYYDGSNGSNSQIGCATATATNFFHTSTADSFSKCGGNPIVARSAGTHINDVAQPFVWKDLNEPDSTKRWKMLANGTNGSPIQGYTELYYSSSPTSGWSAGPEIITSNLISVSLAANNCVRTSGVITCTVSNTLVNGTPVFISAASLACPTSQPTNWFTLTAASGSSFSFAHAGSDGNCTGTGTAYPYDYQGSSLSLFARQGGVNYFLTNTRTGSISGAGAQITQTYYQGSESAPTKTNVITRAPDVTNCRGQLSANVTATRTLTVDSTAGCSAGQLVVVDSDTNTSQGIRAHILRVTDATHVDLYELIDGPASGGYMDGYQRWNNNSGSVYQVNPSLWVIYNTCFRPFADITASVNMSNEEACVFTAPLVNASLTGIARAMPMVYPTADVMGMSGSHENPGFVRAPIPAQPKPRVGRF